MANAFEIKDFEIKDKDGFISELSAKLTSGLANYSKNDIVEYLIYLFNKYDKNRFFDSNTNIQNARLFGLTTARVKNIANNIAYKFMSDTEFEGLLGGFLRSIRDGSIAVRDYDDKHFTLSIENPAMAIFLEQESKKLGFNYELGNNRELYIVPKEALVKILEQNEQTKEIAKSLNKQIKPNTIKDFTASLFKEALKAVSFAININLN